MPIESTSSTNIGAAQMVWLKLITPSLVGAGVGSMRGLRSADMRDSLRQLGSQFGWEL